MKQHITIEQLQEIRGKAYEQLDKWWRKNYWEKPIEPAADLWDVGDYEGHKPKYDSLPLLSIGQMIEFLEDGWEWSVFSPSGWPEDGEILPDNNSLCDALWEAIKEVLEK